ncbi:MAG: hypothetical protein NT022_00615 [Deltaproteobacteria bacterium]|nr:hypothetical protein [Deltaproteobacteria bacterium]
MKKIILLLTILLIIPAVGYSQAVMSKTPPSAKQALAKLRASLDLVKNADDDKPFTAPTYKASSLIGLSRSQISSALGEPNTCVSIMAAPCQDKSDLFYSFYKLPKNYRGGGPELLLKFGKNDVCKSATWAFTQ